MKKLSSGLVLVAAVVLLSACGIPQDSADRRGSDAAALQVTEPAAATADNVTEPATEAPTAYQFRWIGSDPADINDATGFVSVSQVIPDAVIDMRYYSDYNFVGTRINGYEEPVALLSEEAAFALRKAADELRKEGYLIKLYDAYRPQRAVEHFASWAADADDTKMKADFYPSLDKSVLFDYGYIAYYSGHSRGSKVDMTLVNAETKQELDMGGTFDLFDERSHPDYEGVTAEQYQNRMILRDAMLRNGFSPCSTEWWDFTLDNEPYPDTYFDFSVSLSSLRY